MLKIDDNKTCQIDHILINQFGIFVIETKNYSGRIYGYENQHEWTQVLNYGKVKNKLYNPIHQNRTHIYHIHNILDDNSLPVISAVVFIKGNTQFINASGIYTLKELRSLIKNGETTLPVFKMKAVYNKLIAAKDSTITNREHISNINSMKQKIDENICPRCNQKLVLRKGKNGDFMGCSSYPKCKFIKKL